MNDLARPLLAALETANFNLGVQLGDVTNDVATRRARGDTGSSISWIVGHLLSFRCQALRACGGDHSTSYDELFAFDVPATDGRHYPDIAALREDWNTLHAKLREAIGGLTREALLGGSPLPNPHGDNTLAGTLAFYAWHEAYHIGAIGMLRVQWSHRHTHELAMEALRG